MSRGERLCPEVPVTAVIPRHAAVSRSATLRCSREAR